jgi:hypothetical protein
MNKIPYIGFGDTAYIDQSTAERIPTHEFMMQEVNHMRAVCIAYQEEIKLYKEALELQRNMINASKKYNDKLYQQNINSLIVIVLMGMIYIGSIIKLLGII